MTTKVKNQIVAILCKRLDKCENLRNRAFRLSLNIFCNDEKSLNKWNKAISIYSHYVKEINDIEDMLNYISK